MFCATRTAFRITIRILKRYLLILKTSYIWRQIIFSPFLSFDSDGMFGWQKHSGYPGLHRGHLWRSTRSDQFHERNRRFHVWRPDFPHQDSWREHYPTESQAPAIIRDFPIHYGKGLKEGKYQLLYMEYTIQSDCPDIDGRKGSSAWGATLPSVRMGSPPKPTVTSESACMGTVRRKIRTG